MNGRLLSGIAVAAALTFAGAAQADTTVFNSTPTATWYYGGGNDYAPANTIVLTTDAGDELYLRAHQYQVVAPASTDDTYTFPTGLNYINFDWGITSHTGSLDGLTAQLDFVNYAGGSSSYDAFFTGNDNEIQGGSVQNSNRLIWVPPGLGFDPNVDGSYGVKLTVGGLEGGEKSLSMRIDVGAGFQPVPEPATWALMIIGFGGAGAVARRRRRGVVA